MRVHNSALVYQEVQKLCSTGILSETQTCVCENKFVPSASPIDLEIALPCRRPRACFLSEPNWTFHDYSLPLNKNINQMETVSFQLTQMELLWCSLEFRSSSWTPAAAQRSSALKQAHCHGFKPQTLDSMREICLCCLQSSTLPCSAAAWRPPGDPAQYGCPVPWWALVQHRRKSDTQRRTLTHSPKISSGEVFSYFVVDLLKSFNNGWSVHGLHTGPPQVFHPPLPTPRLQISKKLIFSSRSLQLL